MPDDGAVVADAVECADAVGAALTFVHAVPCSFGERSVDLAGAVARGQRLLDTAACAAEALSAGLSPSHAAPAGAPARAGGRGARRRPARDRRAPDRATGTDHRGSVQPGGLGLVAHSALHHAPCPVLLTPR